MHKLPIKTAFHIQQHQHQHGNAPPIQSRHKTEGAMAIKLYLIFHSSNPQENHACLQKRRYEEKGFSLFFRQKILFILLLCGLTF